MPLFKSFMGMDALPTSHVLTVEELKFKADLSKKEQELHALAIQWLQTSYRLEWSHMWKVK